MLYRKYTDCHKKIRCFLGGISLQVMRMKLLIKLILKDNEVIEVNATMMIRGYFLHGLFDKSFHFSIMLCVTHYSQLRIVQNSVIYWNKKEKNRLMKVYIYNINQRQSSITYRIFLHRYGHAFIPIQNVIQYFCQPSGYSVVTYPQYQCLYMSTNSGLIHFCYVVNYQHI